MLRSNGFMACFAGVVLISLCQTGSCLAEGYFQLVLNDGKIVQGDMIRVTPFTIEIDPDGPPTYAVYNRTAIKEILYKKGKLKEESAAENGARENLSAENSGYLALKYNIKKGPEIYSSSTWARDYVMIDGALYNSGFFCDMLIGLSPGTHFLELSGVNFAYWEPSEIYYFRKPAKKGKIWRQEDRFYYSDELDFEIEKGKTTYIVIEKKIMDYLFISRTDSKVYKAGKFEKPIAGSFKAVSLEDGISPGRLIFDRLPDSRLIDDTLQYKYRMVFNESDRARFNESVFIPGEYTIETEAFIWNTRRERTVFNSFGGCVFEIREGQTTWISFSSEDLNLKCFPSIYPTTTFEITTR